MRLIDIEQEIYGTLGYGDNPDSEVTARVRRSANIVYKSLFTKKGLGKLRRMPLTFVSVANSPFAVLPQAATRIISIQDRTNNLEVDSISLEDLRANDPGLFMTAAYASEYVLLNYAAPVALDPTAAAELFVKSDSTGDGNGVTAYLNGVTSGGYPRQANITMNGTTAVSLDATITDWLNLTKFYISAQAKGNVTLRQGSGAGTELARIPPGRSYARYTRLHLHPTPTGVATYYVDAELLVDDLIASNDEPIFWEDWHWLIPCGILMREFNRPSKKEPILYDNERRRFDKGVAELQVELARHGTSSGSHGWSQLGSMYPAGS